LWLLLFPFVENTISPLFEKVNNFFKKFYLFQLNLKRWWGKLEVRKGGSKNRLHRGLAIIEKKENILIFQGVKPGQRRSIRIDREVSIKTAYFVIFKRVMLALTNEM